MKPIVIFGTSEIADLAAYYFENDTPRQVVAFTADDDYVDETVHHGLPVVPFSNVSAQYPPDTHDMFIALSYVKLNRLRQRKFEQAKALGYKLASYIATSATTWPDLVVGENVMILENQVIQPTVTIGDNVMLWSGNHIGHGSEIGDHVYLASHVVLSGHCKVGSRSFIGVNATVKDFTAIGDDCFIGMGANVVRDCPPGSVVVGESGSVYDAEDRRARALMRKYFGPDLDF